MRPELREILGDSVGDGKRTTLDQLPQAHGNQRLRARVDTQQAAVVDRATAGVVAKGGCASQPPVAGNSDLTAADPALLYLGPSTGKNCLQPRAADTAVLWSCCL